MGLRLSIARERDDSKDGNARPTEDTRGDTQGDTEDRGQDLFEGPLPIRGPVDGKTDSRHLSEITLFPTDRVHDVTFPPRHPVSVTQVEGHEEEQSNLRKGTEGLLSFNLGHMKHHEYQEREELSKKLGWTPYSECQVEMLLMDNVTHKRYMEGAGAQTGHTGSSDRFKKSNRTRSWQLLLSDNISASTAFWERRGGGIFL